MRRVVWCVEGMRYFGELCASILECELMVEAYTGDVDEVFIVGMYDPPTYEHTLKMTQRAKKRVIIWCGTDVLLLSNPELLPDAVHVADYQPLVDELAIKGVEAKEVMWPTRHHFPVMPLPDEPNVSVYFGSDPLRYGVDVVQAVAEALPDINVFAYQYGSNGPEGMADIVARTRVHVRFTEHDGSAASPREMMEAGRRCVVTNGLKHATNVDFGDVAGAARAVRAALKHDEPDYEAAAYWKAQNSPERWLAQMRDLGVV